MTNNESELDRKADGRPLVFHLEVLRQNYGKHILTQEDLATMSGVSRVRLGRYERAREVPRVLYDLVAVSYALGISNIEALIAPEVRETILTEVDQHRALRGLPQLRTRANPPIGFRPEIGS